MLSPKVRLFKAMLEALRETGVPEGHTITAHLLFDNKDEMPYKDNLRPLWTLRVPYDQPDLAAARGLKAFPLSPISHCCVRQYDNELEVRAYGGH